MKAEPRVYNSPGSKVCTSDVSPFGQRSGFSRICLVILFLLLQQFGLAQGTEFRGIIINELNSKPVPEANIRVSGTNKGTFTDKKGQFSLSISKLPSRIIISCIGYENSGYTIREVSGKQVELHIRPVIYNLKEVEISSVKHAVVYQDRSYSVLDYELMDDNLLLIVFRNILKQSEIVLLTRNGDTLSVIDPPGLPPDKLYEDFLSNVHYYSKEALTWQCFYNKENRSLGFLNATPADTLEKHIKPFLFRISGRLYFQEKILDGFGTKIGYYSRNEGKRYIKTCLYENKISEYFDDQNFYREWNRVTGSFNALDSGEIGSPSEFDFSVSETEGGAYGKNEIRAHRFEFYNMIFPLIKIHGDSLAFFNFGNDIIEILDRDGKTKRTVPINFHHEVSVKSRSKKINSLETSGWRWGTKILTDRSDQDVYTTFIKNGMVKICKIDLLTGKPGEETVLPFPFPEKIRIYKGEAYFLYKESGYQENWKLVKCRL
ncbi:MAG: carboxypeptidase-like regulatory domain-containing protein [Bacteroidetes bacterium]|nr:carboxypeptidase-like regulatory domain-containing protein [Bacteroidota bacterium]